MCCLACVHCVLIYSQKFLWTQDHNIFSYRPGPRASLTFCWHAWTVMYPLPLSASQCVYPRNRSEPCAVWHVLIAVLLHSQSQLCPLRP